MGVARSADEWIRSFAAAGPHVDALIAKWRERWCISDWSLESPALGGSIWGTDVLGINGPGGFGVWIFDKVAELYHCSPWGLFLYDTEHQSMMRAACYGLARVFKSEMAIYAPELSGPGMAHGRDLEIVRRGFESKWGPPAASLADLATNSESAPRLQCPGCYYVDQFTDMIDRARKELRHGP